MRMQHERIVRLAFELLSDSYEHRIREDDGVQVAMDKEYSQLEYLQACDIIFGFMKCLDLGNVAWPTRYEMHTISMIEIQGEENGT